MTIRRPLFLTLAGLAVGAALVLLVTWPSTSRLSSDAAGPATTEPAYGVIPRPPLPTSTPVAAVDPSDPSAGLANHDGSVVVSLVDTRISFTAADGVRRVDTGSSGELRAVSASGHLAAQFERPGDGTSVITVVDDRRPDEIQRYQFSGLIEPEAFSTDGNLLYVIDHETDRNTGGYRVRPLDLASGELQPTLGPSKRELVEVMNGRGRRQVWSPDASRLYTLYIRQTHHHHHADEGGDGEAHIHPEPGTDAFVHVLDLTEEWAFCLDLPPEFGAGDLATTALAVSPTGREVAVVDASAGLIAFASTEDLTVSRTAAMPTIPLDGELHLGLTGQHLALGLGTELRWFDRDTLDPVGEGADQLPQVLGALTSGSRSVLAWSADPDTAPMELPAPIVPGNPST